MGSRGKRSEVKDARRKAEGGGMPEGTLGGRGFGYEGIMTYLYVVLKNTY